MKIFFVSTMAGAAWGGSEELWAQAALRCKQQGHEVEATICSIQTPQRPKRIEELISANIKVRVARTQTTGFTILRDAIQSRLRRYLRLGESADQTSAWILEGKPDLVVFSDGSNTGNITWLKACRTNGIPYVTVAQAVNENWWPDDNSAENFRGFLQDAKRCFFVSKANLETTRLEFGVGEENLEVLNNPFNVDYDVHLLWPDETQTFRMAFVGRLEPGAKGCDLLLKAMSDPVWKSRNVELHFYGTGASARGVQLMAELLNVEHCFFHGHVASITEVWKEHHLLVLPSRYEGLPLAVVEAMLCGRPCLVTNVSGNAELLEDNVTGFVAAGATVGCLTEALERAWAARDTWRSMGERASTAVRSQVPRDPAGEFAARLVTIATK